MEKSSKKCDLKSSFRSRLNCLKSKSFDDLVEYFYQPTDPSSLGVIRALFGLLMLVDLPEERGGSDLDYRWGDGRDCHFPLLPAIINPPGFCTVSLLYFVLFVAEIGIMIGYKFRQSIIIFTITYWYIYLLDVSFWNNHSYLYGLVAILLMGSSANHYCSVDAIIDKSLWNKPVPYWNYFILKFQFFMLYFLAGLKKTDQEWLDGFSVAKLGSHWVFMPFQFFLTTDQIAYLIIHWFGFLLDLTIGFWMLINVTRPLALIFCSCFHLMNSRLFSIGMFPYVCLATLPLFCEENWPRKIQSLFMKVVNSNPVQLVLVLKARCYSSSSCLSASQTVQVASSNADCICPNAESGGGGGGDVGNGNKVLLDNKMMNDINEGGCGGMVPVERNLPYGLQKQKQQQKVQDGRRVFTWRHRLVTVLLLSHCGLQAFLPYSHFITKGYNNWTNGLYGYSWDMMVHSWDTIHVVVKVVDNKSGSEFFIDSKAFTLNERWNKHASMCVQYAQCLQRNLLNDFEENEGYLLTSDDLSIYVDVWCSLNGRFQQRMYNPNYDLLKAQWSPFKPVEWQLPLLTEYNEFRSKMHEISEQVYSWSNYSDVLFVADFPGLYLENFIGDDLTNVSLTVIEGKVVYVTDEENSQQSLGVVLTEGESLPVETGTFHKIYTISTTPATYYYTYLKESKDEQQDKQKAERKRVYSPFPLIEDIPGRIKAFTQMMKHIFNAFMHVAFKISLPDYKKTRLITSK